MAKLNSSTDKLIVKLRAAGKTLILAQTASGKFYCTVTGKGWNLGGFITNSNPAVLFENAVAEIRRSHPRAVETVQVKDAQLMETARNEARHALVMNAHAIYEKGVHTFRIDYDGQSWFATSESFKTYLRPLGFIGVYMF